MSEFFQLVNGIDVSKIPVDDMRCFVEIGAAVHLEAETGIEYNRIVHLPVFFTAHGETVDPWRKINRR